MNETLEQIARKVADGMPIIESNDDDAWLMEYSRRLVAALGAQEPAGHYCVSYFRGCAGMANTEFHPSIDFAEGTHALYAAPVVKEGEVVVTTDEDGRAVAVTRQDEEGRILKVLWEAPAVNPDWQMVPKKPTPAMLDSAQRLDWTDSDVRGNCINQWQAMLAAAPEYKP